MMHRRRTSEGSEGSSSIQMDLRRSSCCARPAWLLSSLADLDQKIRSLVHSSYNENNEADTFAQRAESYYQQRPQLLSLLLDLYNAYLSLAERYCQSLHKHHNHQPAGHHRAFSSIDNISGSSLYDNHSKQDCQSEAESSLSYQFQSRSVSITSHSDDIISELVIKNVEIDLLVDELGMTGKQTHESLRKIELQRSLLEVLESERMILVNENAGLRYKVHALIEVNKGLASESMFMKRKTGELARCVLKMREDHRVCMLSRKIEELQGKIFGLEKRNREYYQQLVKREGILCSKCNKASGKTMSTEACVQEDKDQRGINRKNSVRISKFWGKVKKSDFLFLCKPR